MKNPTGQTIHLTGPPDHPFRILAISGDKRQLLAEQVNANGRLGSNIFAVIGIHAVDWVDRTCPEADCIITRQLPLRLKLYGD